MKKELSRNRYEELVKEAQTLMTRTSLIKMKIAKIALEACTIRHGGISGDLYTLHRFATDVGVSRKQLSMWCLTYKNVVHHIEDLVLTEDDWISACRVHALITKENTKQRSERGIKGTKQRLYLPQRDEVLEMMARVQKDSTMSVIKCEKYISRAHHHLAICVQEGLTENVDGLMVLLHVDNIIKECNAIKALLK